METIDQSRLATYFGVLLLLIVGFEMVSFVAEIPMVGLAPIYMFTPLGAAGVVMWRHETRPSTVGLRLGRVRWLVIAAIVPVALALVALGLSLAVPAIGFDPGADLVPGLDLPGGIPGLLATFALAIGLGVTVNAALAFGEEFGWRGYLLWELAPLGFWRASVVIGAVWGLWHAPVIVEGYNYPSFPYIGILAMTAATIAFSFVYTYLVLRSRSVLAAVFFHGVFNASGGLVLALTVTDTAVLEELVASPVGAAGMVTFLLVAVGIYLAGAPTLDRSLGGVG